MTYIPAILQAPIAMGNFILNNSGSTITALSPVIINGSGGISLCNPTDEAGSDSIIGILTSTVANGQSGSVVMLGKIESVTSLGFANGTIVYVSTSGHLTDIVPEVNSNGFTVGDFCIRVGVIVKSQTSPFNSDMLVSIVNEGQL
jgi:hypothetical protein